MAKSTTVWVSRDDSEWGENNIELHLDEPTLDDSVWDSPGAGVASLTLDDCEQLFGFMPAMGEAVKVKLSVEREG